MSGWRVGGPRRNGTAKMIPVALGCIALVGCGEGSVKEAGSPAGEQRHPLVGAKAPDFELPAQGGGESVSPGANSGKVVIVDFWATWCEPCRESFPAYERMTKEHDVVVLGVSVDDEPDDIPRFVADTKVHFPVAWDRDQRVSKVYKPPAMPTSYIIDSEGIVRHVHAGFHPGEDAAIAREVDALAQ